MQHDASLAAQSGWNRGIAPLGPSVIRIFVGVDDIGVCVERGVDRVSRVETHHVALCHGGLCVFRESSKVWYETGVAGGFIHEDASDVNVLCCVGAPALVGGYVCLDIRCIASSPCSVYVSKHDYVVVSIHLGDICDVVRVWQGTRARSVVRIHNDSESGCGIGCNAVEDGLPGVAGGVDVQGQHSRH